MKTRCDCCKARYEIPDDRVLGKVLRVRCKRCQSVMVVVGPTEAFADGDARPPTLTGVAALSASSQPAAASGPVTTFRHGQAPQRTREDLAPIWWVGIAGKPHGPYTKDEMLTLIDRGDVHARSRVWRAPFPSWERICESSSLGWAFERCVARAAEDASQLQGRETTNVFERAAMVSDGEGWFPDPTMKSGWVVLDEETQAYLETCARRGLFNSRAEAEARGAELAALDEGKAWPFLASGTLRPALAAASLALGLAVTGLWWWSHLSGPTI